jgi:hypothetical protein
MKIALKIVDGSTLCVNAHRVFKKEFPKLELYLHYGVNAENKKDSGLYGISTKDGFGVVPYNSLIAWGIAGRVESFIYRVGQDKVIERHNEMRDIILCQTT